MKVGIEIIFIIINRDFFVLSNLEVTQQLNQMILKLQNNT